MGYKQMKVSQQDLCKIVEQASTLTERLGEHFIPNESLINKELINSRWEAWCQVVAQGNPKKFAKRLVWNGLDSTAVGDILSAVCLANPIKLPSWTETLQKALQTDWKTAHAATSRCLNSEKPVPFEDVYLPFVHIARQKLVAQVGACWQLLSETAHICLERQLLLQLAFLCSQSLELEFSQFKVLKQSTFTFLWGRQDTGSNEHYRTFVTDLTTDKLFSFFLKYSVLARLVGTKIDFWVEEKAEFLQRLAADLPTIQQNFFEDIGQVVDLQCDLSDLHNQGRSVIAVTFTSGFKLVYKPRGIGLEAGYFQLLAWCNQQQVLLPFKSLKIIDCKTHGWMEYVEHFPCEVEAAVQRYYQRAGMLLCLLYVLQGNDCHQENLIASGEHPVLVDLETLLEPRAPEVDPMMEVMAQSLANEQFYQNSVLRTGLLPRWEFGADGGRAHDVSGLGGVGGEIPIQWPKWQNINTDGMALKYELGTMPPGANTPLLGGTTLPPNDYVDEIVDGFRQMYQFLSERRETLLAPDSPLAILANQRVRFLFRPSKVYSHILGKTLQPQFLRYGVDRSIELDILSRALLVAGTKPSVWSLLAVELQALEQMDIPYFTADSSSDALTVNPDLIIERYFKEPSYDRMISGLRQLDDADLTQQIGIIQGSLYSRIARGMSSLTPTERAGAGLERDTTVPLTETQLIQEAVLIAIELQQRAIQASDGSATWIGMGYHPKAGRLQLQPLGDGLYDGVCGVALFLAALAKVTHDTRFQDLALSALQPLSKTLQKPDLGFRHKITKQIGIGGGPGLGSIIYSLVRTSQFLDQPGLLDVANCGASLITQESITGDRQFDPILGSAGAILGLLALYQAKPNPGILEQVVSCGYHLLNNRVKNSSGFRVWVTLEGKSATGFSHGAAGIAYALLRLYKITQEPVFLEAAEEAIAYERSIFSPDTRNRPNADDMTSLMTSWCRGAPGIGLARLGGLTILDTPEIRQDIAGAVNTTKQFGLQTIDHLCCGNFGRVEVLLVAAAKLSSTDLEEVVQKQAARIVARAKQVGSFHLFPELPKDVYNPGFFQGTAGIGYQLLRLACPDSLPCVLMWE